MKCSLFIGFFLLGNLLLLGQTSLHYNLRSGEVFTVKQTAQQIITHQVDGVSREITNNISGVMEFEVKGEINDTYELDVTFRSLTMQMTSSEQGELLNVNASEVIEGDVQSKIFNSLLDIPIQIILAKTGNVMEVRGGDSLVTRMASASGLEDEFSLGLMKQSLQSDFGSEALSNSYNQMTYIYPTKPKNIGESWENEYSGKLSARNNWRLEELSETSAKISGRATVVMAVDETATSMYLTGSQETEVQTNLATGFIEKMIVKGVSEGISTISLLGDQEIPTRITSSVTYQLLEN